MSGGYIGGLKKGAELAAPSTRCTGIGGDIGHEQLNCSKNGQFVILRDKFIGVHVLHHFFNEFLF